MVVNGEATTPEARVPTEAGAGTDAAPIVLALAHVVVVVEFQGSHRTRGATATAICTCGAGGGREAPVARGVCAGGSGGGGCAGGSGGGGCRLGPLRLGAGGGRGAQKGRRHQPRSVPLIRSR